METNQENVNLQSEDTQDSNINVETSNPYTNTQQLTFTYNIISGIYSTTTTKLGGVFFIEFEENKPSLDIYIINSETSNDCFIKHLEAPNGEKTITFKLDMTYMDNQTIKFKTSQVVTKATVLY